MDDPLGIKSPVGILKIHPTHTRAHSYLAPVIIMSQIWIIHIVHLLFDKLRPL